ncbi:hypothetical protein AA309_00080 [Microvirga vignae]|uniref:Uncharacterized protein n=1 Tax=Microvirga vignae TaxID=1225564 RepID=A0A0H1RIN3_9HYPH|nr:hypothetical protein AA309_00080 [Microvirga vignae]
MTVISRTPDVKRIDDVAQLLNQVVDAEANSRHAHELLDEISQLLWAISSLDPDAEHLLKHSDYVADLVSRPPR